MVFAAGIIYRTFVATWKDVSLVKRNVALPRLIRTLKMMGSHKLIFAVIEGVFIGVEQLVQNFRAKRFFQWCRILCFITSFMSCALYLVAWVLLVPISP